jgi:hypothetical protein
MSRLEFPHPDRGHVVMEWEENTTTEEDTRQTFEKLIAEGWGAAETLPDGTEQFTRKFNGGARIIKMIPRFKGG